MLRFIGLRALIIALAVVAAGLGVAACGGGSSSSSETATEANSEPTESEAPAESEAESEGNEAEGASGELKAGDKIEGKGIKIAYLGASKANAFVAAAEKGMEKISPETGVDIKYFDAEFDPNKQLSQCQDAVASGEFEAIITLAAVGAVIVPCAAAAEEAGIPLVATNQPIGPSEPTGEPTAQGVTAQVITPLPTIAEGEAEKVAAACAKTNPCKVIWLRAAKLIPEQDAAYGKAFEAIEKENPSIEVIGVEAGAERAGGLSAMQDALQRVPDPTVITAPNTEPIEGAVQALKEANLEPGKDVLVVSNGGTEHLLAAVESGEYFSTYLQVPETESEAALELAVKAVGGEEVPNWIEPHEYSGLPLFVEKGNLSELPSGFKGQW